MSVDSHPPSHSQRYSRPFSGRSAAALRSRLKSLLCARLGKTMGALSSYFDPPGLRHNEAGPIPRRSNWLGRGRRKKTVSTGADGCRIAGAQDAK
jgi:hypothetical protein